jgi:hypothetical protein
MKVWISVDNKPFEASSYKIISPVNGDNPLNLDEYIDTNECEEIVVEDVLESLPHNSIATYISHLATKLRHGGQITISGSDTNEINKAYYISAISLTEYNQFVFGTKASAWHFKQSSTNLNEVTNLLKSAGLKIIHKRLPNFHYSVTAERP